MPDRNTRTRNLVLAAGLALAAALLTMFYVARAKGGTPASAELETAPVLVATSDLPVGTSATQALARHQIVVRQLPVVSIESGALTTTSTLLGDVVVQTVYSGEQLTGRRFGRSGAVGLRAALSGDQRIFAVPGDANQLLAGTVQDGDHVDVIASLKDGTDQTPYTKIVLRDLLVLQAPVASAVGTSTGQSTLSATLELTDAQAQKLFFVMENGNWSFVLRSAAHGTATAALPKTSATTLLNAPR